MENCMEFVFKSAGETLKSKQGTNRAKDKGSFMPYDWEG